MTQLAWLHAAPDRTKCDQPEISSYTEWLISKLFSIGVGNPDRPLGYPDLLAWCELAGFKFDIWECELMINLASSYLHGLTKYKDSCSPPFMTEETRITRGKTIARLRHEALKQVNK